MAQEGILNNRQNFAVTLINFIIRSILSIFGFLTWIGYMDIIQLILVILVLFIFNIGIQILVYIIKKNSSHQNDQIIELIITIFISTLVGLTLIFLPFNMMTVTLITFASFTGIAVLGFIFPKIGLKEDDNRNKYNIYFVCVLIAFFLMVLTFDLVFLILLYVFIILHFVTLNVKYNIWKKLQYQTRVFLVGILIFVFLFFASLMIVNQYFL